MYSWNEHRRSGSFSSDDSHPVDSDKPVPPPVLVYHESARSIVFRDHLRRAKLKSQKSSVSSLGRRDSSDSVGSSAVEIANFNPMVKPLPPLELTSRDAFAPLLQDLVPGDLTAAEKDVVRIFSEQRACVKTLKNSDWTAFLRHFWKPELRHNDSRFPHVHDDSAPHDNLIYNSFVTSTTLLPKDGIKMRAFGSTKEYTTGVVFALPEGFVNDETETEAVHRTKTWAWPSGYAAKTEFNIDSRGRLINGREEALVSLEKMRQNSDDYIHKEDYKILGRVVKGGLTTVPYNEVFLRVGGLGRIVSSKDVASNKEVSDERGTGRSFDKGVGLPVAFFVRTASYGHLISLLRTRARVSHVLGQEAMNNTPLLLITPELGVRVLTNKMEQDLLKIAARDLNPFQNTAIAYKTTIDNTKEGELKQKMEELLDLNSDNMRRMLTPEERARLAGGFGATDESTVKLLMEAKLNDNGNSSKTMHVPEEDQPHQLQDIVNEGLAAAVRSGDYHTARQLLILYTVVATNGNEVTSIDSEPGDEGTVVDDKTHIVKSTKSDEPFCDAVVKRNQNGELQQHTIPSPPPPPPLDTDRLRSATNSDGLLAVLGAAQVLRAMKDGGAKIRVAESIGAIEEWVEHGQNSVAFRLASWRDQHAAQADLKIAMQTNSNFMAFVSNKAVTNRKAFAEKLKTAVSSTDFESVEFLKAIHEIVSRMHSPCLRLELLQFVLGLDNRFSVAHLARSVELAAACLSITTSPPTSLKQLEVNDS
mmetsp:Transcript_23382/g.38696  ORF Transcript_23382/g.38696 Transcript_23382/m.38696 type:complete len:759 (+) Transcript_23382:507-2783(+)|eukprot:CAMPEP_0119014472 /NCGR_PEP_ID=MMETSP1176-20130426/9808_1 /TAXON_ID=265551 /ORGANISM="Synedropsis recta cf, Strain CCMP1620" /LENGTH=758 /DNA_ID=CAMNT_0006967661 /DNA_START=452 /DNA_END=2728 /DNA_ORIENTATION=-